MRIKVTTERECCEGPDLKPIDRSPRVGSHSRFVFCVHCGRHLEYESFTDAAGGADWRYVHRPTPWVQDGIAWRPDGTTED